MLYLFSLIFTCRKSIKEKSKWLKPAKSGEERKIGTAVNTACEPGEMMRSEPGEMVRSEPAEIDLSMPAEMVQSEYQALSDSNRNTGIYDRLQ